MILAMWLWAACAPETMVAEAPPAAVAPVAERWTCPMHPSVQAPAFGRCPLCGMDLVRMEVDASPGAVRVQAEQAERFGIRTAVAADRALTRTVRFAGPVGWDLRRQRDVSVRASGTVEGLRVAVGSPVRAGDALFSLRSPELVAAQAELLAAQGPARDAARARLGALGLTAPQIEGVLARGAPLDPVPVLAPSAGEVSVLDVVEGSPAAPGVALVRLADAGAVWVEATLSAPEAALLRDGAAAAVRVDGLPEALAGTVHPLASGDATSRVRVQVRDAAGRLRPGALAVVEVPVALPVAVVVPADAVVYAGTRKVVFVVTEDRYLPREVHLLARVGDEVALADGLAAGEVVAASGAFLVAADSRLRAPAAWESR